MISAAVCLLAAVSCVEPVENVLEAAFEADKTDVKVGEEVSFNDLSTGTITRWTWTFEGAEPDTSVLTQPKICWYKVGTFSVSLTVGDGKTQSSVTKDHLITVSYHSTVKADFTISKTKAYSNEKIVFTNTSEGFPETVKWTFTPKSGTPVTSTEYSPELTLEPGVYTVKLEISNPLASDSKTVADALTILNPNEVTAKIGSANATTYAGATVNYQAVTEGPVKVYEWTFEGGEPATSSEANPKVKYAAVGAYRVTLTVRNGEYNDTDDVVGYVHVLPSDNLVFLLPFDGDLKDYGPNGLNPSVYSKADLAISFEEGHGHGLSARFPGGEKGKSYAVLQMPDVLKEVVPVGNELTVSWWSKTPVVAANEAIFAQGECPSYNPAGNNQLWCRFQPGNPASIRCTAETAGAGSNTSTINKPQMQDDKWHNITVVYGNGGNDLRLYFDGVGQAAQNGKGAKETAILPYFIGCNLRWTGGAPAPENMYSGLLDDYVFYKKAMTEAEVKAIYDAGKPVSK